MTGALPISAWLILSALLFAIGLAGALTRKNAIMVLVSIEIMMNAANVNLIAFWRYGMIDMSAQMLVLFAIAVAGAESAVGLALVISSFRHLKNVDIDDIKSLSG